jgi:hypothetical protein
MAYIIAKQDNEPVFANSRTELDAQLKKLNMTRGRFVHQGGTPIEIAPLYKANGWLRGCIYYVHVSGCLGHGLDANASIAGNVVAA